MHIFNCLVCLLVGVEGIRRSKVRSIPCEHETDCSVSAWCGDTGYERYCRETGERGSCPTPQCRVANGSPTPTQSPSTPAPTQSPSTPAPTPPVSNCYPLSGRTYKLLVTGYDGANTLNKWLGFADNQEYLYARYEYSDAMPVHFVAYPGYCNTYQLRNDWEEMQKYVCMEGEWLRAGCDSRSSAIPVEFFIQSNGQYKMYNRQPGFYNFVSYSLWPNYQAVRSQYDNAGAMRVSLYNEVNLLAPHSITICFYAVLSVSGGSAGIITKALKFSYGKSSTKTYQNEIIAETSLSIGATFPFPNFLASASNSFALKNTAIETSSVTTNSFEERSYGYEVDLSLPAYIYQTIVTTRYKNNGVTVQKSANPTHVLSTPLEVPCVEQLM